MLKDHMQDLETLKRREHDIEIMQLLLKHNLIRKRAEYKLLIMYYKACNMLLKTKMMLSGIDSSGAETHGAPEIDSDSRRASLWEEHFEKLSSSY
jgi:hypothetical protein